MWPIWLIFVGTFVFGQVARVAAPGLDSSEVSEYLRLQIREAGDVQAPKTPPVRLATGQPLTDAEIEALFDSLPDLPVLAPVDDLFQRSPSRPAPRPGRTEAHAFPPERSEAAPQSEAVGPLEVLRISPSGDVAMAGRVMIAFSQPMVPLGQLSEIEAEGVPAVLSPMPEDGRWRWLDPRVLVFEGESRLPGATNFEVRIDQGTTSALGGVLAEPVIHRFRTPPPQVLDFIPHGRNIQLNPVMGLVADQDLDPELALQAVRVTASGVKVPVVLVEDFEPSNQFAITPFRFLETGARRILFQPTQPLPRNAEVIIEVRDLKSAEGERSAAKVFRHDFRTYGDFKVRETRCGWRNECGYQSPFVVSFTNPIDETTFSKDWINVTPEVPDLQVTTAYDQLQITGLFAGDTTYEVLVDQTLADVYGQTLSESLQLSFKTGDARPVLSGAGQGMKVLPPTRDAVYRIYSMNYQALRVRVFRVDVADWVQSSEALRSMFDNRRRKTVGDLVKDVRIDIDAKNLFQQTDVDLSEALKEDRGQVMVWVEPIREMSGATPANRVKPVLTTWIQRTDLAIDAFIDGRRGYFRVTSFEQGGPVSGAELSLVALDSGAVIASGRSDAEGTWAVDLPEDRTGELAVQAKSGDDIAFLSESPYVHSPNRASSWTRQPEETRPAWFTFDDRNLYQPGEGVQVKGWLRRLQDGKPVLMRDARSVQYKVYDPRGSVLAEGDGALSAVGGFDLAFTLPDDVNLGQGRVEIRPVGALETYVQIHLFQIEEFRRPEFEVSLDAPAGPFYPGDAVVLTGEASYFAGGALAGADTTWRFSVTPTFFRPPNWDRFQFGHVQPWAYVRPIGAPAQEIQYSGMTDMRGRHGVTLDVTSVKEPVAHQVNVTTEVVDLNQQVMTASDHFMVFPGELLVGLRLERAFAAMDSELETEVIVVDVDGEPVSDQTVTLRLERVRWERAQGVWRERLELVDEWRLTSAEAPLTHLLQPEIAGSFRLTAQVRDDEGRLAETRFPLWIYGGSNVELTRVEEGEIRLLPDREAYEVGDVAEVMVQLPFAPATLDVLVMRNTVLQRETLDVDETLTRLSIPIEAGMEAGVSVKVHAVGLTAGPEISASGPLMPAFASGQVRLTVPPKSRALEVIVTPEASQIRPGGELDVHVRVRDAQEAAAETEVALFVVDEAVLALGGYQLDDPLDFFYPQPSPRLQSQHLHRMLMPFSPDLEHALEANQPTNIRRSLQRAAMPVGEMAEMAPMSAMADDGGGAPVMLRQNFDALAYWAPNLRTSGGEVRVRITLPDNLTRYRIVAVAADETRFGKGEASLTARLPLMVRASPPRFLNFGDRCELPVLLQNQTDEAMSVHVALRGVNVRMTDEAGWRVDVPAQDRVRVIFPIETVNVGNMHLQVVARGEGGGDAAMMTVPVFTPATSEAFAVYGVLDEDVVVAQPIQPPQSAFESFGGLKITTSSTAVASLTDAYVYLRDYPYESVDLYASRSIAVLLLGELMADFDETFDVDAVRMQVRKDLTKLETLQNGDGGFGFWRRGERSWPFLSVHVAHAVGRARLEDLEPSVGMTEALLRYLRAIKRHTSNYSVNVQRVVEAYALWTRHLLGDDVSLEARALFSSVSVEGHAFETLGWLLPFLSSSQADTVIGFLDNRIDETAGDASFVSRFGDDDHLILHGDRRTDGVLLDALIAVRPEHPLIPKLVAGLMNGRTNGRWRAIQENLFVLAAMSRYYETFEQATPNFVASVWLGEAFAGESRFEGRETLRREIQAPMSWLMARGEQDLLLQKVGDGRLYYRVGLSYAPMDLQPEAVSRGFYVSRVYEAMDDPDDVRLDEHGVWHVRLGVRVRVRLMMVTSGRRHHVALMDALPGGLETLNPLLRAERPVSADPFLSGGLRRWRASWFQHQNLRDERAEAFALSLSGGAYEYVYVARATTAGDFQAPPAKAEEMYAPETFGRSAADRLVVFE